MKQAGTSDFGTWGRYTELPLEAMTSDQKGECSGGCRDGAARRCGLFVSLGRHSQDSDGVGARCRQTRGTTGAAKLAKQKNQVAARCGYLL
jgi:hypothetical protein